MSLRSRANLTIRAATLIGCLLAVWPSASAPAQVAVSKAPVTAASLNGSQQDIETMPDQTAVAGVDHSMALAPGHSQAGSREFAQQYVTEKLAVWQQRLKLTDWRITWAMTRRTDLKPNTVGQIHWDKPSKQASILVMDSCDYKMPFEAMLDDMELTIIHELVHLKLTSLPHSEASRGSEEQAVNGLSEALFALEHPKQ